jgi:hypothetical protein
MMLQFRIPLRIWAAFAAFVPLVTLPIFYFTRSSGLLPFWVTLGPFLIILSVSLLSSLYISELRVSSDGLILNRFNRLAWSEVTAARLRSFGGLPYLFVNRRRGSSWWIPLYYSGPVDLREALLQHAPEGHPVRRALA